MCTNNYTESFLHIFQFFCLSFVGLCVWVNRSEQELELIGSNYMHTERKTQRNYIITRSLILHLLRLYHYSAKEKGKERTKLG